MQNKNFNNSTPEKKFHTDKSYGQHFLADKKVLQKIVEAGELTIQDCVLEIGTGQGALTQELVQKAGQVVSFEVDNRLISWLQEKFSLEKNLEIKNEDVLSFDLNYWEVEQYKIVANIPYNITSKILEKFLLANKKPQLIVLLIQKEVAERICAREGEKSFLSIMVQYFGEPQIVQVVRPSAFIPPPQVDSAVLKISKIASRVSEIQEKFFFKVVKIGFSQKRKMLKKNLKSVFPEDLLKKSFESVGLDLEVRAEDLSVAQWLKLAEKLA